MSEKKILNLGCGNTSYGTSRIDVAKTSTTTDVGDLNKKFPYKDNSFDEIFSSSLLEHLKDIGSFADECFRVLKKGGKIYVKTDFAGYLPFHLFKSHEHNAFLKVQYSGGEGFGHEEGEDAHYHLFVASHLHKLFKRFKNHKISYFYSGRNKLNRFLLKLLPNHMGANGIALEAIK